MTPPDFEPETVHWSDRAIRWFAFLAPIVVLGGGLALCVGGRDLTTEDYYHRCQDMERRFAGEAFAFTVRMVGLRNHRWFLSDDANWPDIYHSLPPDTALPMIYHYQRSDGAKEPYRNLLIDTNLGLTDPDTVLQRSDRAKQRAHCLIEFNFSLTDAIAVGDSVWKPLGTTHLVVQKPNGYRLHFGIVCSLEDRYGGGFRQLHWPEDSLAVTAPPPAE